MEYDFRLEFAHGAIQSRMVTEVSALIIYDAANTADGEQAGIGFGIKGIAAHGCAEPGEPQGKPAAFESSVTG
jgi:hypothetical protein